ncbi:hypothetical protein Rmet_6559 [Cupriavidus metallidurans CH34]|uniref:Uncharacterized protein n=1 Tax=Cupriavidus metallidurans (strain ATCC 43123 / DSM 2839 / NBRC 102507 / CH34) TaxID=266264 RepID=D3DXZ5_CUPMC|nr:hypothetical protein Rmet_6559 [Cupriavidus metallidurans CH34]
MILLRRTIRDLLQVPDHVTGCFSFVTTPTTLLVVANMPQRAISDGGGTPRCENAPHTARKPMFNRLQI